MNELEKLLANPTTRVSIETLTAIASERAAFGDDVHAAFRSQAELRSASAKMPYKKLLPELRAQSTAHAFGGAAKRLRRERQDRRGRSPA